MRRPECEEMACAYCPESQSCPDYVANGDADPEPPRHLRRVYIAHPMSDFPAQYLHNCGNMVGCWLELANLGFSPYCPATDMVLGLLWGAVMSDPPTVEQYRRWSMDWLEASEAVLVLGTHHADGRRSDGVADEIRRADECRIPVFYSVEDLCRERGTEP